MITVTVNNELELTCPDGFHVMDEEERKSLKMLEDGSWMGLSCPEKNLMITAGWKKIGLFPALMLSPSDLARGTEKQISGAMASYGYSLRGFTERNIAGSPAKGFSYSYDAQGTGMRGECSILKLNRTLYYLYLYAREEQQEESSEIWEDILTSAKKI